MIRRLEVKEVRHYGYRQARVSTIVMTIDRNSVDGKEIEDQLIEMSGARPDNHVVFSVLTKDENNLVFFISDSDIHVGFGVVEKRW